MLWIDTVHSLKDAIELTIVEKCILQSLTSLKEKRAETILKIERQYILEKQR